MEALITVEGVAAPLNRANVDTDQIIPKQFLKRIERTGFGQFLFFDWRYLQDGTTPNPEFILNKQQYANPVILLAGKNFGCGSSREHAPWALKDYGIKIVIAPSFADIFYNNCFQNGMLPIVLPEEQLEILMKRVIEHPGTRLKVDVSKQTIEDDGGNVISFQLDPFRKNCLLEGLDDIGITLKLTSEISSFEAKRPSWLRGVNNLGV